MCSNVDNTDKLIDVRGVLNDSSQDAGRYIANVPFDLTNEQARRNNVTINTQSLTINTRSHICTKLFL